MSKDVPITAAASVFAGSTVAPLGFFLGVPLEAVIAGFAGSLFSLMMSGPMAKPLPIVGSLCSGMFGGMFLGPYAQALLHSVVNIPVADAAELYAASFLLGAGSQRIVPALIARGTQTVETGTLPRKE